MLLFRHCFSEFEFAGGQASYIVHIVEVLFAVYFVHQIIDRGVMVISKLSCAGLLEIDPSYNGLVCLSYQAPSFAIVLDQFLSRSPLTL